jgi:hypothetical protein
MNLLFSENKVYATLFFFLPSVIFVIWMNSYYQNQSTIFSSYLFVFSAILFSYLVSLPFADKLSKKLKFTFTKILFMLLLTVCSIIILLIITNMLASFYYPTGAVWIGPPTSCPRFTHCLYLPIAFFLVISVVIQLVSYKISSKIFS